jgi:hypothetical protein
MHRHISAQIVSLPLLLVKKIGRACGASCHGPRHKMLHNRHPLSNPACTLQLSVFTRGTELIRIQTESDPTRAWNQRQRDVWLMRVAI